MLSDPEHFVIGQSALPVHGEATPQEIKSPALDLVTPEHTQFYRIDPALYFDQAVAEREWRALWTRTWICAGRTSDLARVGDWIKFDVGRESFIITRSANDKFSAFYNACQHRGARLVDAPSGHTQRFVCSYHSWSFDREGRCKSITDRDLFHSESLSGELDIQQVRCETLFGFVFINMDDQAPSLLAFFDEIPALLDAYRMDEMIVRNDILVEHVCNWKTMQDAFSENYHVHMAHPLASEVINDREVQMDFYKHGHARRITPVGVHNTRRGPPGPINNLQRHLLSTVGIDPERYRGDSGSVRRAMQAAKRAMTGRAAEVYSPLADGQLTDDWAMNIFPNMHWSVHAEGVLLLQFLPHAKDPEQCYIRIMVIGHRGMPFDFFLPADTARVEKERPALIHTRHDDPDLEAKISTLLWEDVVITKRVQSALRSRGLRCVRLSEQEQVIRHQHAHRHRYLQLG